MLHIRSRHKQKLRGTHTTAQCPFCDVKYFRWEGSRSCVKHIGHHMEEIAFGVVSTAYETLSYDESESDSDPYDPGLKLRFLDSSDSSSSLDSRDFYMDPRPEHKQDAHNNTQYEMNFWTEKMTAASSGSSANSGLRDPYPKEYFSASSASSGFSGRYSEKRPKKTTRQRPKNNAERTSSAKRIDMWKATLRPDHTPTPHRFLSYQDRRRICQYHEDNPTVKQSDIGGKLLLFVRRSILCD